MGGIIGNILTAIFAQANIAHYDGTDISGGWLDKHYIQLGYNLANSCAGLVYSFSVTVSLQTSRLKKVCSLLHLFFGIETDSYPLGDAYDSWATFTSVGGY